MNAISIGPLVFSSERFAAILGITVFLVVTSVLASKAEPRMNKWSWWCLFWGLVGARGGHILAHLDSFAAEPLRIFALWQGGFSIWGASFAVLGTLVLTFWRQAGLIAYATSSIAAGLFVWMTISMLLSSSVAPMAPAKQFALLESVEQVSLADRRDRPVVVNLWATWCPPCRRELPMMADVARANKAVDFVFANQGEGREVVRKYLQQAGIDLTVPIQDPFSELSRHYSVLGLPVTLFIGADGTLISSHMGEISREALGEGVQRLLR